MSVLERALGYSNFVKMFNFLLAAFLLFLYPSFHHAFLTLSPPHTLEALVVIPFPNQQFLLKEKNYV